MKVIKLIPLLLFFTIIINQSFSQTGWFKLYPNTTNYFTALYFIGVDTGLIGTSSGTIQKTVNGGINWTQQNSGSNQGVHSIHFLINAGTYEVDFDGENPTSGIYYYVIRKENFIDTKKMILIK